MIIRCATPKRNSGDDPANFTASMLKACAHFKLLCPACGFPSVCRVLLRHETREAAAALLPVRCAKVSRAKSPCITMGFGNNCCYLWFFLGGDA